MDNESINALIGAQEVPISNNLPVDSLFTTRLQLIHDTSKVRKEWKAENGPKPEAGDFLVGPPGAKLIGREFDAVSIFWRDHALQTRADEVTMESFDCPVRGMPPKNQDQEIFRMIEASKRSGDKKVQSRIGKDLMLWIPSEQKIVVYFLANTASREAVNACVYDKEAKKYKFGYHVHFKSRETPPSSSGYQWWLPEIEVVGLPTAEMLPPQEILEDEFKKFIQPVPKGSGRVDNSGVDGRPR